jgi:hypothetical protein
METSCCKGVKPSYWDLKRTQSLKYNTILRTIEMRIPSEQNANNSLHMIVTVIGDYRQVREQDKMCS